MPTGVVVESPDRAQPARQPRQGDEAPAGDAGGSRDCEKRAAAQAADRKLQVGSGDRSQRIRTYNYPQGRITDHRVEGLTLYDLPNILEGDLAPLIVRLQQEQQAEALAQLAREA